MQPSPYHSDPSIAELSPKSYLHLPKLSLSRIETPNATLQEFDHSHYDHGQWQGTSSLSLVCWQSAYPSFSYSCPASRLSKRCTLRPRQKNDPRYYDDDHYHHRERGRYYDGSYDPGLRPAPTSQVRTQSKSKVTFKTPRRSREDSDSIRVYPGPTSRVTRVRTADAPRRRKTK